MTDTWSRKLEALTKHASQIGDIDQFYIRMRSRHTEDSSDESPRYEEVYRRIVFRLKVIKSSEFFSYLSTI